MKKETTHYLFVTFGGRVDCDVIAVKESNNYYNLINYCKNNNLMYREITEGQAYRLLVDRNGIGTGCFIPNNSCHIDNEERMLLAGNRFLHLSDRLGWIKAENPTALMHGHIIITNTED